MLRPHQRVRLRYWAYWAAGGTNAAAVMYLILLSFWPDVFLHWLGGLTVGLAAMVANGLALTCYAHKVRLRREEERRLRAWRQTQAVRLRAAMEAPTQVITILPPRPAAYVAMEDRLRLHLLSELTERTGELSAYERPTPPPGWRSGVA
jgi:hypothetical protein